MSVLACARRRNRQADRQTGRQADRQADRENPSAAHFTLQGCDHPTHRTSAARTLVVPVPRSVRSCRSASGSARQTPSLLRTCQVQRIQKARKHVYCTMHLTVISTCFGSSQLSGSHAVADSLLYRRADAHRDERLLPRLDDLLRNTLTSLWSRLTR